MRNLDHSRILAARLFATALLVASAVSVLAGVHYVDVNSTNATPPYTNWTTAATSIQHAVDAAVAGDEVVVTNGTYASGGRNGNRVTVDKPLNLRSVNGPQFTIIDGGHVSRCVYLTNSAILSGFTLSGGFTYNGGLDGVTYSGGGGGVRCESASAVVSNCAISGNLNYDGSGGSGGGGAYGGTLNNCTLTGNSAGWAFPYDSYGSGAYSCILNNCTLTGNAAGGSDGYNCSSFTVGLGGGAYNCILNNCTLSGNSVTGAFQYNGDPYSGVPFAEGGGAYNCFLNNCIFYFNTNWYYCDYAGGVDDYVGSVANHCWASPSNPLFVDYAGGNLRLQSNSPCINAGNNAFAPAGTDLDGNPRIAGGTVDIGAYEFQSPVSMISYAWLQTHGLPINSSTDTADPDGDGVNNYHEWLAGTDPTNSLSSPAQLTMTPSGVAPGAIILTWSTNAVGFALQSTTNLLSPAAWVTNSPAPVVINGLNAVTNPISGVQKFYRLSHE